MFASLSRGHVLPGFTLALGYTIAYLSLIVLLPLSAVLFKTFELSFEQFWAIISNPRVVASFKLSFGASLIALIFIGLPAAVGQAENTLVVFTSNNGGERFSQMWPFSGQKTELREGDWKYLKKY